VQGSSGRRWNKRLTNPVTLRGGKSPKRGTVTLYKRKTDLRHKYTKTLTNGIAIE